LEFGSRVGVINSKNNKREKKRIFWKKSVKTNPTILFVFLKGVRPHFLRLEQKQI